MTILCLHQEPNKEASERNEANGADSAMMEPASKGRIVFRCVNGEESRHISKTRDVNDQCLCEAVFCK